MGDVTASERSFFQEFRFDPQRPPLPWAVLTARNVAGYLEGADPRRRSEVVILGAHYDGQGRIGEADGDRILPTEKLTHDIWNSADDNASGVAALIEVARSLSKTRPARSVLFLAFSAEEHALNGSVAYVTTPLLPWSQHVAMVNLEKLGRAANLPLITAGSSTSPVWEGITKRANAATRMKVESAISEILADTDHYPFAARGLPAIVVGVAHEQDTHQNTDTSDKIDYRVLAKRTDYVIHFITELANLNEKPVYTGNHWHDPGLLVVLPSEAERSSAGVPRLMGALKVSAVIPGLPAIAADIQPGDLIIAIGDRPLRSIKNMSDKTSALKIAMQAAPDRAAKITLVRKGRRLSRKIQDFS
jgi:hypothetical protein